MPYISRVSDKVYALHPTRATAPEAPATATAALSTDPDRRPANRGNAPMSPPDAPSEQRTTAAESVASAPLAAGVNREMPAFHETATRGTAATSSAAPVGHRHAGWLGNAAIGACLVGLATCWWLYGGAIADHLERTLLPSTRPPIDPARIKQPVQQRDGQAPVREEGLAEDRARNRAHEERPATSQTSAADRGRMIAPVTPPASPPSTSEGSETERMLQQERDRARRLTRELDVVWRELRAQTATSADKAALDQELADLREALHQSEWQSATYEALLAQERARNGWLEDQLMALRDAAPRQDGAPASKPAAPPDALPLPGQSGEPARPSKQKPTVNASPSVSDAPALSPDDPSPARAARPAGSATAQAPEDAPSMRGEVPTGVDQGMGTSGTAGATLAPAREQPPLPVSKQPVTAPADEPASPTVPQATLAEPAGPATARATQPDAQPGSRGDGETSPSSAPAALPVVAVGKPPPTPDKRTATAAADEPASPAVAPVAPAAGGGRELARLMVRASVLLSQGNIGAARAVLERAAETGDAAALFALAETYDPLVLLAWGTFGTQGDIAKAQELYRKALAGGIQEANNRLSKLP